MKKNETLTIMDDYFTHDEAKEIIMNMYKISSKLIEKLKKSEYKINTNRKKVKKRN